MLKVFKIWTHQRFQLYASKCTWLLYTHSERQRVRGWDTSEHSGNFHSQYHNHVHWIPKSFVARSPQGGLYLSSKKLYTCHVPLIFRRALGWGKVWVSVFDCSAGFLKENFGVLLKLSHMKIYYELTTYSRPHLYNFFEWWINILILNFSGC